MINFLKCGIIVVFIFVITGCGKEDTIAHIGEEVNSTLTATNVTDDTQEYYKNSLTVSVGSNSYISFSIINGNAYACGNGNDGALGLGDFADRNVFTDTGLTDVKSIYSTGVSTFALKNDGTLWATGKNSFGMFGIGNTEDTNTFINTNVTNVKSLSISNNHAMIIKNDGTLWATGYNLHGQLGLGDNEDRYVYTKTNILDAKTVSAGGLHTFIIKNDGTVLSVGFNSDGQLGLGDALNRNVFTEVDINNVFFIEAGYNNTFIIKNDGTLWATGNNIFGKLGLGDATNRSSFVDTAHTGVTNVSAGLYHSFLIKNDGNVYSTGRNADGQLGLGDNIDVNVFTDTSITDGLVAHAGIGHTLLTKTDYSIFSTGDNSQGQLGLGDNTDRNSFTDTTQNADIYLDEGTIFFYDGDFVRIEDNRYVVSLLSDESPSTFVSLTQIGVVNKLKPFDNQNITPAISASPMTYTITATGEFNSFTLAKVLADSVTYTFKNSVGTTIKTGTRSIDLKRDASGILSAYPTTVIIYADTQIEAGGTVEISLTRSSGNIELGDFTLNNAIDAGYTNLTFTNGIRDFNNYTPDEWGNIPEGVKAIVTTHDVTMDVPIANYDHMVSFLESISGKNVTIDASDSNGEAGNGSTIFASLTRRVRIIQPSISTKVKDGKIAQMTQVRLKAREIV